MNEINPNKNIEFREFNSDIDLVSTFRTILRGKFFILSICSITYLISFFQANRIAPVWQGEVNIVMRDGDKGGNMPDLGQLSKFVKTRNSKKTEELIITSPLVLMPVFNYVKTYYEDNGVKKNKFTFKKWKKKN